MALLPHSLWPLPICLRAVVGSHRPSSGPNRRHDGVSGGDPDHSAHSTLHRPAGGSFIQGLGTGSGGAMSRTVMRDRYNGAELNRANSLVSMGVIFSPLLAPVLGGWLTELFNWRAGYWFLFGFGAVTTLALLAWFGETLPVAARQQPLRVSAAYRHVLSNPRFQGNLLCLMATFAGLAVFEAAAGVLLGDVLKLSARTVSVLFVLPLPGYLFGAWLSAKLSFRLSQGKLMRLGIVFWRSVL